MASKKRFRDDNVDAYWRPPELRMDLYNQLPNDLQRMIQSFLYHAFTLKLDKQIRQIRQTADTYRKDMYYWEATRHKETPILTRIPNDGLFLRFFSHWTFCQIRKGGIITRYITYTDSDIYMITLNETSKEVRCGDSGYIGTFWNDIQPMVDELKSNWTHDRPFDRYLRCSGGEEKAKKILALPLNNVLWRQVRGIEEFGIWSFLGVDVTAWYGNQHFLSVITL